MAKTAQMESFLETFSQKAFGRSRKSPACAICGSIQVAPSDFHDALSRREFEISHLCQKCQDKVFLGTEEE